MTRAGRGYTNLELILVIILLGILSVSVYNVWPEQQIDLYAESHRLEAMIRYAQTLAMTRAERMRVNFTSSSASISNLANTETIRMPGDYSTSLQLQSGVTLTTSGNLPNSYVVFDNYGSPYSDAATPGTKLSSSATLTLSTSNNNRQVSIVPETGKVGVS